ncbi:VWA domain-containing protein [Mariniflexile litorale]|uniref:VWA domain-containing protein n=1 Tax=Mariniflexile litorale TaxID=3045158 RepID=A0AAU7EEQ9_9FLAO|nr:VWA domain-containing protein [Mariniflexile sp. KMM 9835]MDQ8211467.1 VWA domain-containing protein [Mariniflexile sp. KMM 9835]
MSYTTLLFIVIAGIFALLLAGFQYKWNKKSMSKLNMLFLFLRFVTVFSVLLLLINPKLEQITLSTIKPNLVIAVDNSNSVKYLKQDVATNRLVENLKASKSLNDKFNMETYTLGEKLKASNSFEFNEKQTNIEAAFIQLSQIYKQTISPTILITDGNQTYGNSYEFSHHNYKQPIYPIILGDTVRYTDLKIQQLNVNKYAYLKNQFPVETILVFNGETAVNSKFVVTNGNNVVYSEIINFTKQNNSKVVNFKLPANSAGVHAYKAQLEPLNNEKNKTNNLKNFAIEVIDQKTKIALVSDMVHPDLGALKKSIESNEQRSVSLLNSNNILKQINDFQLVIIYQPNNKFNKLYDALNLENKNRFTIIGTKTDLNFLKSINKTFTHEITNQTESYQAELNKNYAPFIIEDINFESFPPLNSQYGSAAFSIPFETILNKTIHGISKTDPLLATFETSGRREAVLFGENIWQWRAQSYLDNKSFHPFDDFIGKLIQYVASNKQKSRLNIENESFYNGNTNVIIKAEFFDKNYEFDTRETLTITVKNAVTNESKTFPLILNNSNYQVDLSSLPAADYSFIVIASKENISKTGRFKILEYNVEQQFLNADVTKLQQLATNSQGESFFVNNTERLIENLLKDNRFVTIQKSNKNSLPLIDWKYLLIIITLSLSIEWFLRKYNGLI